MREKEKKARKNQNPQTKVLIAVVAVCVCLCIAMAAIIIFLLNREPEVQLIAGPERGAYPRDIGGRGFVVTPENVEEVRELRARRPQLDEADRYFEFSLVPDWIFPTAREPSPNALIRNVANNSRMIFFDVSVDDTVVYVSPYMPLGSEHRGFALDYDLAPGTYSAVITHFLVDDDFEIITDVSVGVTIIVEN